MGGGWVVGEMVEWWNMGGVVEYGWNGGVVEYGWSGGLRVLVDGLVGGWSYN